MAEFSNLNGYDVKDKIAREDLTDLNNKVDYDNYLEDITWEKERHYDTDCYVLTIPLRDSDNNILMPYVAYHPNENPFEFAQKDKTTVTINGSISVDSAYNVYPILISNGEVINEFTNYSSLPTYSYYIGIKDDRSISTYPYNTSSSTMLNDGVKEAFLTFGKILNEGTIVTPTYANASVNNPRTALGVKSDGTMIIIVCDGRYGNNKGLLCTELAQIFIDKNCVNAWNLDGGGSSSLTIKGSKINRYIEEDGTEERFMKSTLNFKKQTKFENLTEVFNKIGEEKKNIIQMMFGSLVSMNTAVIDGKDLNTLVGRLIFGYGNNCTNKPSSSNGYLINIPHSSVTYEYAYNVQIWIDRDLSNMYVRNQVNGTFTEWSCISSNNKAYFVANDKTINKLTTTSSYQKLYFALDKSANSSIIHVNPSSLDASSRCYNEFKINKTGFVTIRAIIQVKVTVPGVRFIRFLKNDSQLNTMGQTYAYVDSSINNYMTIVNEFLVNNDSVDNIYSVALYGFQDDFANRVNIFVETN